MSRPAAPAPTHLGRQRPRVGVVKFASCDGCQLTLLDCEDELLASPPASRSSTSPRRPRAGRPARTTSPSSRARSARPEQARADPRAPARDAGSSSRSAPAPPPAASRRCATAATTTSSARPSTPHPEYIDRWPARRRSRDHVTVDFELRGCPIDQRQLLELLAALVLGRRPQIRDERLRGVQAARQRLRHGRARHAVPRPGHAGRLRRPLPGASTAAATAASGHASGQHGAPRAMVRRRRQREPEVGRLFAGFTACAEPFRTIVDARAVHGDRPGCPLTEATMHDRLDWPARRSTSTSLLDPRRGRGLAPPPGPRRRGRRGAARDLRGAALLRAARRRADAGRGHRHRRPDLRDLPRRLPDERGPRVRGRASASRSTRQVRAAAPAALLRRVDREPRAPRLPAPRARLPRLSDARSRWRADHRGVVERGLAIKKVGNELIAVIGGRSIHPVSVRVGGFSRIAAREPSCDAIRPSLDERRRGRPGDRRTGGAASTAPDVHDREPNLVALRHPSRIPVSTRAGSSRRDGLDIAGRPTGTTRSRSSRSRARTPSRPGRTTAASTCSARRRGSRSRGDRLHPLAAEALERDRPARADPDEHLLEHRRPGGRARSTPAPRRVDIIDAYGRRPSRAVALDAAAGRGGMGDGGAARTPVPPLRGRRARAGVRAPRSCRRRARTRPRSRTTWRCSRRASWRCPTPKPRTGSSS